MAADMDVKQRFFPHTQDELKEIASDILRHAKSLGGTDAATEISEGDGLSVSVRRGEVETIEHNRDKMVGVTVFIGNKRGNASTSDFSSQALKDTVAAAYNIARFTAEDDCAGLAEAELLETEPRDLDLYHPWNLSADEAVEIARRAEDAAFATDPQIKNSEGASVSAQHSQFVLATSRGFLAGYPYSRHYIACAPIAGSGRNMQRDDWYTSTRSAEQLADPEAVGRYAAQRALARIGARGLDTRKVPVLFEAPLAAGLLGAFVQATSGGALYRKTSFLVDSLGKPVFAPHVQIVEDPHVPRAMGSAPFDEEGVRTRQRSVVKDGVVEGYFLSTYSARKLGMQTTGNAGGSHNLSLLSSNTRAEDDFEEMLRKLGTGLLLTELMGQGVNYVTGDYSRGASGFWVENGKIQYPVEEITVASTLQEMFRHVVAIGADTITRGTKQTGSVLIERMTIAGQYAVSQRCSGTDENATQFAWRSAFRRASFRFCQRASLRSGRLTSPAFALVCDERVVEIVRCMRAMRFVCDFFPLVRIDRRERRVAVEIGGNFRDDHLVCKTQPFHIQLSTADQKRFGRLVLRGELECFVERGGRVATLETPSDIASHDNVAASRQRPADRLMRFAAHDDGRAHGGPLEKSEVFGESPGQLVVAADHAIIGASNDQGERRHRMEEGT
jgi:PmbA protein